MSDITFLLFPVPALFFLGMLLRRSGVIDETALSFLFRFLSTVCLPALTLSIFPYITLQSSMLFIPVVALAVTLTMLAFALIAVKLLRIEEPLRIAFIGGTVAAYTGFSLPFVKPFFGNEGIAIFLLFNASALFAVRVVSRRGVLVSTTSRPLSGKRDPMRHAIAFTLAIGIAMNVADIRFEPVAAVVLHDLGELTIPLVLLASGASVKVPKGNARALFSGALIRMVGGAASGFAVATLCGLQEMERGIAVLCAAAPAGLSLFPAEREADASGTDFSEALASATMLAGLLLLPLLLFVR
ncbi:MAG: hypothetical protein K9I59_04905 [Chlorobium sp.]|uniref:AEC family transporter n=1 Tax=Chlorobium sp. TaxID=1095 RepID=UPI0025BA26DE|nr:hypothetical protein [Chlorobium sp.]MCF8216119.1 hypothetical protein [Chlorobium sp.]MCF8271080.1 hypothetical protein [Chlorobium sp.]MCF8287394.1 hypothetical protein [Chlorobium sp.]MCF8290993.1 hypothetical protein [Chlorobium sp.]MCF8385088.1 hypothetical protein [Chlorobium sp.]